MAPRSRRAPSSPRAQQKPELAEVPDDPARFPEAIRAFEKRIPMPKAEWESLQKAEREFAFTVADVTQAEVVTQIYEALEYAVKNGTDLETFKEHVGTMLEGAWGDGTDSRIETIFRTNVQTALNEGRYQILTAPAVKKSRPYWRWEAIDDDRIDDDCAPLVDLIIPADDPFWATHVPPLHFNCRCTFTALDQEEVDEEGVGRLDEPPDVDAAEGFGGAPSSSGQDWKPDPDKYPTEIGNVLRDRLDRGG